MTNKSKYLHPRDEILQTIDRIYNYRMTTTSGGNLSIREDDGTIWITPASIDKGGLRREDIVCVKPDGSFEGKHKPSSELPFHQMIYQARPDIRGIVHAHPVALVAFSICGQVPDTRLFHQSTNVCGLPGFAKYGLPGSEVLGRNIAEVFAKGHNAVLLENHGAVVGGESLQNAFQRFETLEFTAKTSIKAKVLGEISYLTDEEIELPKQVSWLEHFEPQEPTSLENELRRQICEFTHRGYRQRLFISTGGSFSARVDDESFLITPFQVDRHTLTADEIVLVKNSKQEAGKIASRAARNHGAIYAAHPGIKAIINSFPVNTTAFGVTRTKLDSRTIPESYILLHDVGDAPYGSQFHNGEELAAKLSLESPILLLENDGVLVVGKNVLDAFDRLEVLESTAEALVNSRILGQVSPMSDGVIEELKVAFNL